MARIQVRRDTAANWTANPTVVLASGEIGYETDTRRLKIGDGSNAWQDLVYPFIGRTIDLSNNIEDLNDVTFTGFYGAGDELDAGNISNTPVADIAFTLLVVDNRFVTGYNVTQTFITIEATPRMYIRSRVGATWGAWVSVGAGGDIDGGNATS